MIIVAGVGGRGEEVVIINSISLSTGFWRFLQYNYFEP